MSATDPTATDVSGATAPSDVLAASARAEPERAIATSIAKRALIAAPIWLIAAGIIWGVGGALSAAYGVGLVVANIFAAAAIITVAARISPAALMAATLGGFVVRLVALLGAVYAVSWSSLFEPWPLGLSVGIGHLGLLAVECRYLSLALAAQPQRNSRQIGSQAPAQENM